MRLTSRPISKSPPRRRSSRGRARPRTTRPASRRLRIFQWSCGSMTAKASARRQGHLAQQGVLQCHGGWRQTANRATPASPTSPDGIFSTASVATRTGSSVPDAWRIAASAKVRNDWRSAERSDVHLWEPHRPVTSWHIELVGELSAPISVAVCHPQSARERYETIPPHERRREASKAICCPAARSFQGSGVARIAAISVIPEWWETPHSARSRGSISGRDRPT